MANWDVVSNSDGNILTAAEINQLQTNFTALAEQSSGAPHTRLSYLKTTSRDAITLTDSSAMIIFNADEKQYQGYDPSIQQWGSIGEGGSVITVVETGHWFSDPDLGKPIGVLNTGSYFICSANCGELSDMVGVMTDILDVNRFKLQQSGAFSLTTSEWSNVISGGLQKGISYWMPWSGSSFKYVTDPPELDGYVDKPVLFGLSNTRALVLNFRGAEIGGNYSVAKTFISSDFSIIDSVYVMSWAHGLNTKYLILQIYDQNVKPVSPSDYYPTSGDELNSTDIEFSGAMITEMSSYEWIMKAIGTGIKSDSLSDATPKPSNSTGSPGTSNNPIRSDHQHPQVTFSVHKNGVNQSITGGVWTKITWDGANAEFDTESAFDDANDRYIPTQEGYYRFSCVVKMTGFISETAVSITLYKNGATYKHLETKCCPSSGGNSIVPGTCEAYANGTTDYFEIYIHHEDSTARDIDGTASSTYFEGHLI